MVPRMVMSRAEVDELTLADIAQTCNVPVSRIVNIYGCTPIQLSMIAETRAEVFHFVLSFGPTADIDRFCEAIRQVVTLNAILRTRLVQCSLGIVQVVTSEEHVTERRFGGLQEYLEDDGKHRLGLGMLLFRTAFIDRVFVATIHHAVMDYWSIATLLGQDIPAAYYGIPLKTRPAYQEFVTHCMNIDESSAKAFWAPRFKGVPAIFPKAKPGLTPFIMQKTARTISLERFGNVVPLNHLPYFIEAAWVLTAATYAATESVAYGYVLSGRSPTLNGIEATLGPTITEVPVQVNLQRNMTVECLIRDRATALRQLQIHPASQYGRADIAAISEAAKVASGFQTLLNIVPVLSMTTEKADVKYGGMVWLRGSFPLQMVCRIQNNTISVEPRFDPAVICDRLLHRVLNQFEHILELLIDAPLHTKLDELPLLNHHDTSEIYGWNKALPPQPAEKCLHELFHARAQTQPEAVAVEASDGNVSYQRLDTLSDILAHELQRRDVSRGTPVALVFDKSLWAIVAILGIMKAGGVCVPLNKHDQFDRKAAILSKTNARIVLTSSTEHAHAIKLKLAPNIIAVGADFLAGSPELPGPLHNGRSRPGPEDLAYITFTSSVGAPKGVLLEHRSLVSSLTAHALQFDWQSSSRIVQFATYESSISMCEIFGALLFGGCLCIPTEEACSSTNFPNFLETAKVNWAMLPPHVLRAMSPDLVPSLRSLVSIGEPVDAEALKSWGSEVRFFNCWGTCEASVLSTIAELVPDSPYPESIGRPVGCAVWIVNPRKIHELTPIGGVGELLIEGPGLTRGYLKDEAATAASFISSPRWASSFGRKATRFFRTGDLGKYNPDGSISFVCRQASQIKLHGQTVRLEEIERVLHSCAEIRDVAIFPKIFAGRTQLVAVLCLANVSPLPQAPMAMVQKLSEVRDEIAKQQLDAVCTFAKSWLPSNWIPALWLTFEQLPRTTSHKLDRASIREWLKKLRR